MPCTKDKRPTWLQKVTFIKRYALNSCSVTPEVYLETGGKALTNLGMTLLFFDTADLVRSFFRPKGMRTGMHSSRIWTRNKGRGKKGGIPEPSDLVADTVRMATGIERPKWTDGTRYLWEIDTALQRQLHKIVFVNMVSDFAFDWFSGILEAPSSVCHLGRFRYSYLAGLEGNHGYQLAPPSFWVYSEGEMSQRVYGALLQEGTWLIKVTGILHPSFTMPKAFTFILALFLGPAGDKQCGDPIVVEVPADGGYVPFTKMHVVKAEDALHVRFAVIIAEPNLGAEVGEIVVTGFRLT